MTSHLKLIYISIVLGIALIFGIFLFSPILKINNQIIVIGNKESVSAITADLRKNHVIFSTFLFKTYIRLLGLDKKIIPGEYLFNGDISLIQVAKKISVGDFGIKQDKIVIPEGSTSKDIGDIIKQTYSDFGASIFSALAKPHEGYLFPDSYDLFVSTSSEDIINVFLKNFDIRTKELHQEADLKSKNWKDVIILASILEEEGRTATDRKIISGILNKRIEAGIALQVDATFRYINGKTTKDLTDDDLKINSPYNTYLYPGLPPTPISNPGLESINAAINPENTEYLYFLTGDDGQMHYAKTFEEHVVNKKRYLR